VVVGSSNTDLVLECARLPRPGETVLGGELTRFAGGKGANQAVAACRAGARVSFVGARGDDDFGRQARRDLHEEGIDLRYFTKKAAAPSGVALILVGGRQRENQIAVARSANDLLSPDDVRAAAPLLRSASVILTQLEVPIDTVEATAQVARELQKPLVLNPGPARKLPSKILRLVDTITPNEQEAEVLSGESDVRRAARVLRRRGCRQVVVTLGARGVWIATDDLEKRLAAPKVKPRDTVGAGDCFTAWLVVGLAEGLNFVDASERAQRAAAVAVTRPGAQAGMPYRKEIV